jgi:hypothetical protein
MKLFLTNAFIVFSAYVFAQSDACASAPSLAVSNGGCSTTGYSIPNTFTPTAGLPFTCGTNFREGFFKVVATSTITEVNVTDDGMISCGFLCSTENTSDPAIAIYSGACGSLTSVTCVNNSAGTANGTETAAFLSTIGQTYYIAIINAISTSGGSDYAQGDICVSNPGHQDCAYPTPVCASSIFSGNSGGARNQELTSSNRGCGSSEHQSSWYVFETQTAGVVQFTISTSVDYDFILWGPNLQCSTLGTPIRCSFSAVTGNTGLGNAAVDNSEGAGGDRWVSTLNVTAGQRYILLVDNFTANATPFTLDFTGTTADLNCNIVLPIELISFTGENQDSYNLINWATASEINNDYFTLERSMDALNWEIAGIIKAGGTSTNKKTYDYKDYTIDKDQINYYRLKQTDLDGHFKYSEIISIVPSNVLEDIINLYPNPTNGEINLKLFSSTKHNLTLTLVDYTGNTLFEKDQLIEQGNNSFSLDIQEYEKGVYLLIASFEESEKTILNKIIKN